MLKRICLENFLFSMGGTSRKLGWSWSGFYRDTGTSTAYLGGIERMSPIWSKVFINLVLKCLSSVSECPYCFNCTKIHLGKVLCISLLEIDNLLALFLINFTCISVFKKSLSLFFVPFLKTSDKKIGIRLKGCLFLF